MQITREDVRRQIDLEDEGRSLGVSRYNSRQLPWKVEAGSIEEEANLPPGRKLLQLIVQPTSDAISAFLEDACSGKAGRRHSVADFLLLSNPTEIAYLAGRCMVNACSGINSLQHTAMLIANALIESVEFSSFREMNRKGYKGFMKSQEKRGYSRQRRSAVKKLFEAENVMVEVGRQERISIGIKLAEIVTEATGLFAIEKSARAKGWLYIIRPTEPLQKWLDDQNARCALLDPVNMPMLVRPRRWRSPSYGGYLTPRPGNKLIKQRNQPYHEELRNVDLGRVYDSVNHIQDTPWSINTRVLEVADVLWKSGGDIGGLPRSEPAEVPAKPHDIDTNEEARNDWKSRAARVYAENASMVSARIACHQKLWVARKFAEEDRVFFPHELDFRGRVYPIPVGGPSPQSDDLGKALLQFADGMALGTHGSIWLTIHIANLFGVDKVTFQERLDWVWAHSDELLASAENPYDNRFWTTADSPFSALAACFEWAGFIAEGDEFVSRLPVALDGSCSGLQHFSAMLRDRVGGSSVNLTISPTPQDVYREVAAKAQAYADTQPTITYKVGKGDEAKTFTIPNPWMNGKVTRTIAKRPTMTYSYSATRFGMQGMILQTLNEIDRDAEVPHLEGADNYHASVWLSHVIWDAISQVVVAASTAMEWLRKVAEIASQAEMPLWWTTPMGLPILQEYKSSVGKRVDTHWAGQRVQMLISLEGKSLDKRSQCNGVAPNFIHSMDAAHLMSVALRCKEKGINHIAVIHDSFGTHAANTALLADILRETFVEQYTPDVLARFRDEMKGQLTDELADQLPPLPAQGDLNLNEVLASSYIFA